MELYEKNGNILYILNVLKKYTDAEHLLKASEIQEKIKEIYDVDIDARTIRRNINLLKYKLDYDISTREENNKGYCLLKNLDTDFEPGEIRAIIDNFSYANYIVPSVAKEIIKKCKNMQSIYENEKLYNYQIYIKESKTENMEVIKNIEDISDSIYNLNKIKFDYWKYQITDKLEKTIVSRPIVSPYAIIYNRQQFYLIGIKEGKEEFFYFRLDRIKSLKKLEEKRTLRRTNSQIREYAESTVEMFGGKQETIEAYCHSCLINAIIDEFGKNITIEKINNTKIKLTLKSNVDGFRYWALKNLATVEVITPVSLREEIKEIIKQSNLKYDI